MTSMLIRKVRIPFVIIGRESFLFRVLRFCQSKMSVAHQHFYSVSQGYELSPVGGFISYGTIG